jgi:CRP/FNR family transcriptional regulator, cyclic AMP receptor protein
VNTQTNFLAQTPYFNGCSPLLLARFAAKLRRVRLKAETVLFWEGDEDNAWYLIERGDVAMVRSCQSGVPHVLAELGPGDAFGETNLLESDRENMCSAVAKTDIHLLKLDADVFDGLLSVGDPIAVRMLKAMAIAQGRRLKEMTSILQDLTDTDSLGDLSPLEDPLDVNTVIRSGHLLY